MCGHVYNTLVHGVWVDVLCKLETLYFMIQAKVSYISNTPTLVVEQVLPLMGFIGLSAGDTFISFGGKYI